MPILPVDPVGSGGAGGGGLTPEQEQKIQRIDAEPWSAFEQYTPPIDIISFDGDAFRAIGGALSFTGTSFSTASEETSPSGIAWDGANFWVVGLATDAVYKYDALGVFTGTSFSVASEATNPTGITWDGASFWVVDSASRTVYKYDALGVFTGTSFSVASEDTFPSGITWDGTSFWVVGDSTDAVYKYDTLGVFTGTSFSVASEDTSPSGIAWDGANFWVVGLATDAVYKYDALGVFTGTSFSVASEATNPTGITWDGASFWVVGNSTDAAYKYSRSISIGESPATNPEKWQLLSNGSEVLLSAGMLKKASFSIAGTDLTINADGITQIYNSTDTDAVILRRAVPAKVVDLSTLTDGQTAQVLVRDNAGTIEYFLNTGAKSNEIIEALYASVSNMNGEFEVDRFDNAYALSNFLNNRVLDTDRIKRLQSGGGLDVSNPASDEIEISSGEIYVGVEKRALAAVNTSTDTSLSYDGLNNATTITGWNNTQYVDSGGNLQTLTANRYAINWVFRVVSDETNTARIIVLMGGDDHLLGAAQNEPAPTYSVNLLDEFTELVGKIIIQKDASVPISIEAVRDGRVVRFFNVIDVNTIDYIFAYDTTAQSPAADDTWDDFDFSNNGPLNGWTHTLGTAIFTCPTDGVYEATVEMTVDHTGGADRTMALRCLFNGTEIAGSHAGKDVMGTNAPDPISRTIKFTGVAGQDFKIQFSTDSAVNVMIQPGPEPDAAVTPISATLNINRIS